MQVYLYNNYRINTSLLDRCSNLVVQPWKWTVCVPSGVFLTIFGHKLLLSLSAQPDNV